MVLPEWSITVIGLIAAACTTGAFVPQVLRVWRLKSAKEISFTAFLAFSIGTFTWLVYGLLIQSLPVILANAVTLVLSLTMVGMKWHYDRTAGRSEAATVRS
ncbi:MAG: SemiSWEET transporter [Thermoplasmata archaeon]